MCNSVGMRDVVRGGADPKLEFIPAHFIAGVKVFFCFSFFPGGDSRFVCSRIPKFNER